MIFPIQATLEANGDITFAYKTVPVSIATISVANHRVFVGLSDSYHVDALESASHSGRGANAVTKTFVYHDLDLSDERIGDNAVIRLTALATRNSLETCWECTTQVTSCISGNNPSRPKSVGLCSV